ncbi:MAG: general stress protein CsbD [Bacteroidetes bacterium]|nr:general stress protein CsbD [Bacteroidota bacterium]
MAILPSKPTPEQAIWNNQKSQLKKEFPYLTDEDLQFAEGKKDIMFNNLQIILGKTKSELEQIIAGY